MVSMMQEQCASLYESFAHGVFKTLRQMPQLKRKWLPLLIFAEAINLYYGLLDDGDNNQNCKQIGAELHCAKRRGRMGNLLNMKKMNSGYS